jgi:hypothetical protein
VYARCFNAAGEPIGDEFKVNVSEADVDNWTPAVAISPAGDVVVAYVTVQDGGCDVMARMFDLQGQATSDEFQVNASAPLTGQSMPAIAMNSKGRFAIAWTDWSGGCYAGKSRIMARLYQADGTPEDGEFLVSDLTNADRADVSMDDSGRFVIAWIRMGDTYNRPYGEFIMFRQYEADGTAAGAPVLITGDINSRWCGPSVAIDESGEFVVTWAMGPFPCAIVAQHFDLAGTVVTEPYMVNGRLACHHGHPRIAGDGQGSYLIVWDSQEQDGSCSGVFGQQCRCAGDLTGGESRVNTYAQDRQWYPDVAASQTGEYVVVWTSENQDGSGYGIFGELIAK